MAEEMSGNISVRNEELWLKLQKKVFEQRVADCFMFFRENNIEPILIKGWAVSRFYSKQWERFYTDIDICIEPSLFERAEKLHRTERGSKLALDLHRGFRFLDTLSWEILFERSEVWELEGVGIRVLCPEDHLRVLCVHWLTDGGAFREKLWDIYYLVERRPKDFDWERCLGVVSKTRRRWIICVIGLAHKYLGLSIKNTPFQKEAMDLPKWLIQAVEKEWASEVKLNPLRISMGSRKEFFRQIRKRIPPNPIQATVELEGEFDNGSRIYYQIGDLFKRFVESFLRFWKTGLISRFRSLNRNERKG